jgi:hypothetical protein
VLSASVVPLSLVKRQVEPAPSSTQVAISDTRDAMCIERSELEFERPGTIRASDLSQKRNQSPNPRRGCRWLEREQRPRPRLMMGSAAKRTLPIASAITWRRGRARRIGGLTSRPFRVVGV